MEFQKISSPSLRDLFIEQLEHLILSGKLQVGEKLPPERQLAEMMQVSRAVVNSGKPVCCVFYNIIASVFANG